MNKAKDNYIFLSLLIFTVCGALVRVIGLGDYYYSYDEMWHVYVAKQPTLAAIFHTNLMEDGHPILPYFLWHYLLQIWDNPWSARLPSIIAGILSIPVAYFMGKEIFKNKNGGLFAAFFIAFSKVMIEQSQLVRGYSMMMLFVIIAFWALYIYERKPQLRYILIYFISFALAFLCEFAAAPLVVFSSLYLLYLVWKRSQRKYRDIFLCGVLNLLILIYLVWFQHLLRSVGGLDFANNPTFRENNIVTFIVYNFAVFANGMGFTYFFNYFMPAAGILAFVFLAMIGYGFAFIFRNRMWREIAFVAIFFTVTAILFFMDKLPLIFTRRNIGVVMPILIVAAYGALNFYKSSVILKRYKLQRPDKLARYLGFIGILFMLSFIVYPAKSRINFNDFSYKKEDMNGFFSFLDENIRKNDIVITHGIISYFFWENYGHGTYSKITPDYLKLEGYKVPVYSYKADYRVCGGLCLSIPGLQKAIKFISDKNKNPGFGDDQIVWLPGLFSGNNTYHAIIPLKYETFLNDKEKIMKIDMDENKRSFFLKNLEFKEWLEEKAVKKEVREDCNNKFNGRCNLVYVIFGVRAKDLVDKMRKETYRPPLDALYGHVTSSSMPR